MGKQAVLTMGDDIQMQCTLLKDKLTFTINPTAIVNARLISLDKQTTYTNAILQNNAAAGADWANSLVTVEFAEADTINVTYQGKAFLEVQVDDNGKTTWFEEVRLSQGTIP